MMGSMHICQPRLENRFGPIFPAADNDNVPTGPRPRTCGHAVGSVIDEPVAFALYLLMTGSVVACGLSLLLAIATRFGWSG